MGTAVDENTFAAIMWPEKKIEIVTLARPGHELNAVK